MRIVSYKDLLFVYIWREYIVRYKQSIIGVLWAIMQPLTMMALFVVIFGYVLKTTHKDYPYVLFFYSGILPWTFFSASTNYAIPCLAGNFNLITKIYFPREIIPLAGVAINFIDYLFGLLIYIILLFVYDVHITINALWFIPLLALLIIYTASVGYLLSALNVYYRDVKLASNFILQLLFFASPVIYSLDRVELKWKALLIINPLTYIIENMRRVTIEGRGIILWQFMIEMLIIMLFYALVYKIFIRIERAFADVI
jgi:ABC-type polysaccharide/polyol phosphate export permease